MVGIFADYKDIDAQINHILNRGENGQFSPLGDTSVTKDRRYADAAVTESRRKAAYRIFDAIGGNLSHPYWNQLSTLVQVEYGDPIPPYFGEIGVPRIAATSRDEPRRGFPADADEIESWVEDHLGTYTDVYGTGRRPSNLRGQSDNQLAATALRYSTDSGVILFVGEECYIPMIRIPPDEDSVVIRSIASVHKGATNFKLTATAAGGFAAADVGRRIVIRSATFPAGEVLSDNTIVAVAGANDITLQDEIVPAYTAYKAQVYDGDSVNVKRMADTMMPLSLSWLNVKLAIPMLCKEGDNLFRTAAWLGQEAEKDLINIKAGATHINPIDPQKIIALSQRVT